MTKTAKRLSRCSCKIMMSGYKAFLRFIFLLVTCRPKVCRVSLVGHYIQIIYKTRSKFDMYNDQEQWNHIPSFLILLVSLFLLLSS
jgi:hypothetical protein